MNTIEVKKAADEMVLSFRPYAFFGNPLELTMNEEEEMLNENSTRIAINHCKRVIEVLELSTPGTYTDYFFKKHRLILSELEGRVK